MERLSIAYESNDLVPNCKPRPDEIVFNLEEAIATLIKAGVESSNVAVALFTPEDHIAFASDLFHELFNIQKDARTFADIIRHCHAGRTGPNIPSELDDWLASACSSRRSTPHRAFEMDMCDGRWFWVCETTFAGGWLFLVITDISVLKSNQRTLQLARDAAQLAADTDSLTGLFNRRYAMDAFAREIEKSRAQGRPLCVALIDLDRFKSINDHLGHAAGDRVLCHFAGICRQVLRKRDVFARIGGEEFLLIMPNTAVCEASTAVERLRHSLETSGSVPDIGVEYTFSAGIALLCDETLEQLFHRADRALYTAKNNGRNRLELA